MQIAQEQPRQIPRLVCATAGVFLVILAVVCLVNVGNTPAPSSGSDLSQSPVTTATTSPASQLSASYGNVMTDAATLQLAVKARDTDLYFKTTELFKAHMTELQAQINGFDADTNLDLQGMVPSTNLWTWAGVESDYDTDKSDVESDYDGSTLDSDVSDAESDWAADKSKLEADSAYYEKKYGAAFKWAKNKICMKALDKVLEKIMEKGLEEAGASVMCDTVVCPSTDAAIDALGLGPEDPVADAVVAAITPLCATACTAALEKGITDLINLGLKFVAGTNLDEVDESLCAAFDCPEVPMPANINATLASFEGKVKSFF